MCLRERLLEFVQQKLIDLEKEGDVELTDETSLLQSGLFDSLAILQLATWIDGEMDAPIDLASIDFLQDWDTVADIVRFIESRRADT